jgi:hypothetical protein
MSRGVTLTPDQHALVQVDYFRNRREFCERAGVVPPTVHRALAGLPVLRSIRDALLRAAESSNPQPAQAAG